MPNDALNDQSGTTDPAESLATHAHPSEVIYVFDDRRSPITAEDPRVTPSRRQRHQPVAPAKDFMQRIAAMFKRTPTPPPAANDPNDFIEEFYGPVVMMVADPNAFAPYIDQDIEASDYVPQTSTSSHSKRYPSTSTARFTTAAPAQAASTASPVEYPRVDSNH